MRKEFVMQLPVIAVARHAQSVDAGEPIRCAAAAKESRAQRHKREMLRYFVLVIALLAVFLLISIALYYTQGNSVTIVHTSSLAPRFILRG
jgi:hypothetical protein